MQTRLTDSVAEAAQILKAGQTVIFPTETVYGLGANALDPEAAQRIYTAKNRPADNPLIVHIYERGQIEQLAQHIPDYAWQLVEEFFPGPLTLLLYKRPLIPDTTTAGSPKVCLRMPSLWVAQEFLRECALPVAAPSANLSGRPSPTRWQDCLEDMEGRVAAILKGPDATFGLESTIVDCTDDFPILMRPGSVTLEQLSQLVPSIRLTATPAQLNTVLPGSKYRHYSPNASVFLLDKSAPPLDVNAPFGYIGLVNPAQFFQAAPAYAFVAPDITAYVHELFAFFHECDRRNLPIIYAEPVELEGLGRALMNRLQKAVG